MPVYKYKREDGTTFEVHQSMDDDKLEECPETEQKCTRLISGGITTMFVGSRWPDKQARKKDIKPGETTLPEYKQRIDENTEKAKEIKEKARDGETVTGKIA
jgi:putative FmdB family regulatory protein